MAILISPGFLIKPLSRLKFWQSRSYTWPSAVCRKDPGSSNTPNQSNSEYKDFRPLWVYSASHILTYTTIPAVFLYCVFLADWGDREDHVFMPPRRWLERQKASFFSLSPAEQELAKISDADSKKQ